MYVEDDIEIYQMTAAGVALQATVAGTYFREYAELNWNRFTHFSIRPADSASSITFDLISDLPSGEIRPYSNP
jgi:hypothetical protein